MRRLDSLERVVHMMKSDRALGAVFGSYDDSHQPDFVSEYRNLMHHFVHQNSRREAQTFWSGFGAIRKNVFQQHEGFDTSFRRPSIEDIELGYRLARSGCKVILEPTLQVTHLKAWTFSGMLMTDVMDRGIPWTELMLRSGSMPNDLNITIGQRLSVVLSFIITAAAIVASAIYPRIFLAPVVGVIFLLLAFYEMRVIVERRVKGASATLVLASVLAVVSIGRTAPYCRRVASLRFCFISSS